MRLIAACSCSWFINAGRFLFCATIGAEMSFIVEVIAMRGDRISGRREQQR